MGDEPQSFGTSTIDEVKQMSPVELDGYVRAKLPSWGEHLPASARQELEVTIDRLVDFAKSSDTTAGVSR